ncbi:MAG: pyruvate formate lyase family protein [Desulfuromonadaceae bacterium]|nr:pyruvate formate lyase family protein [Desulfuromonadaceae bacterium]
MKSANAEKMLEAGVTGHFKEIDALELSDRIHRWKDARNTAQFRVCVEREKLAMKSWKESEGEDIELRRALLFKEIAEGSPIDILDFDLIVGRPSKGLLDAVTETDVAGDHIPGVWDDSADDVLDMTMHIKGGLSKEDRKVLQDAARCFHKQSAPARVTDAWRRVVGTWSDDMDEAKLRDPWLSAAFFPAAVMAPLWSHVLEGGLRSFIEKAKEKVRRFIETEQTEIDRLYFWQASIITCEALIAYAHRYARLAREMAKKESNEKRKQELVRIAEVCEWVPEHPARTFHEAVQSIHFIYLGKILEQPTYPPVIGRADQFLWPYFEKDFYAGKVTLPEAAELLACVVGHLGSHTFVANADFRESHQVSYGINLINVGGVDQDGKDASNLLSYLLLHVVGLLNLSTPSVGVQWHKDVAPWLLDKAFDTNVKTKGGTPLFENGDHVVASLLKGDVSDKDARDWYSLGCVTPMISNRVDHYGAEGLGAFNVAGIFDVTMHNGVSAVTGKKVGLETGDPRNFQSFEELYGAFKKQLEFIVGRLFWLASIALKENERYIRFPFLSTVVAEGCMEYGEDLMTPNPAYHTFLLTDRAIVDAADSLVAIKKLVFDEGRLTMTELLEALDANFAGERGEEIRQMCLSAPKFGNDIDEADLMVRDLGAFSGNIISSYDNSPYPRFRISREGLSWHYYGGLGVGALPNGRKSLEPLNDGSISPMRGMDKRGPTGVIRSVLKAGFEESSATVLNQKFPASLMRSAENRGKLVKLTEAFMKNGGQHIQYNLVDFEELMDAKARPDDHKDLVVRIGGFSAYFVELSPSIQDDVIDRSEQGL